VQALTNSVKQLQDTRSDKLHTEQCYCETFFTQFLSLLMDWLIFVGLAVIQTVLFYCTRQTLLDKQTITVLRLANYLYTFTTEFKKKKQEIEVFCLMKASKLDL
jgi:hypothetical protein